MGVDNLIQKGFVLLLLVASLILLKKFFMSSLSPQSGRAWPVGSVLLTRASVWWRLEIAASARTAIPRWTEPRGSVTAPSSWPSWRRSFTSTSTWRGPGGWRSPAPCSLARPRWKFGFRTDAWRRRNYRETGYSPTQGPRLRTHTPTLWTPAPSTDRPSQKKKKSKQTNKHLPLNSWTASCVTRQVCKCFDWRLHRFQSGFTFICLQRWMLNARSAKASFFMQERAQTICHSLRLQTGALIWILKFNSSHCAPIYTM